MSSVPSLALKDLLSAALSRAYNEDTTVIFVLPSLQKAREACIACASTEVFKNVTGGVYDLTNNQLFVGPRGCVRFMSMEHPDWNNQSKRMRGYDPVVRQYVWGE